MAIASLKGLGKGETGHALLLSPVAARVGAVASHSWKTANPSHLWSPNGSQESETGRAFFWLSVDLDCVPKVRRFGEGRLVVVARMDCEGQMVYEQVKQDFLFDAPSSTRARNMAPVSCVTDAAAGYGFMESWEHRVVNGSPECLQQVTAVAFEVVVAFARFSCLRAPRYYRLLVLHLRP